MLDILIVEDNKEIAGLLCDFLRNENYIVSVADTGEKAMEIFEMYGAKLITKTSHTQNELSTLKTQYYSETNMKFRQQQAF